MSKQVEVSKKDWDQHQKHGVQLEDNQFYRRNADGTCSWLRHGQWVEVLFYFVDRGLSKAGFPRGIKVLDDPQPVGHLVTFNQSVYMLMDDGHIARREGDEWKLVVSADKSQWGVWETKIASLFEPKVPMATPVVQSEVKTVNYTEHLETYENSTFVWRSWFGFGYLTIKAGHWRDADNKVFTDLGWDGKQWLGRNTMGEWFPIKPSQKLMGLYCAHQSIDTALKIWNKQPQKIWNRQQQKTPEQRIEEVRVKYEALAAESSKSIKPVQEVETNKTDGLKTRSKVVSVVEYGRHHAEGVYLILPGCKSYHDYRRNLDGSVDYRAPDGWRPSTDQKKASDAMTEAGWPADLELESITETYRPTELKGLARAYWRAIDTMVYWAQGTRWLLFGSSKKSTAG